MSNRLYEQATIFVGLSYNLWAFGGLPDVLPAKDFEVPSKIEAQPSLMRIENVFLPKV